MAHKAAGQSPAAGESGKGERNTTMEREKLGSRLGFILLSAGCAIGLGNVWRFPYITGEYGGAIFVLIYLFFLVAVGVPVMTMEFAVGRAARRSTVQAYRVLEKPGQKWHLHGYVAMAGNYLLMMFYTVITGWMLNYFFQYCAGGFEGVSGEGIDAVFNNMLADPGTMIFWMAVVVVLGFGVCSLGLQKGVERITKVIMLALLALIVVLAIHSITLKGGAEGLKFYLLPDLDRMLEAGVIETVGAAMNQSFFTLSLGIGAMQIFGSYMKSDRSLLGESVRIAALDTFVAFTAGLIIFPACFAYGVDTTSGPPLIFLTLPNVFAAMPGGRLWGALFFLFMFFAALSTVIAVFENIVSCWMDNWGLSRRRAVLANFVIILIASLPCALGYNVWSGVVIPHIGDIQTFEDFLVSNLILPIGSVVYLLFCVSRWGWGFDNYIGEANTGEGLKVPRGLRVYLTWVLPIMVVLVLAQALWTFFA